MSLFDISKSDPMRSIPAPNTNDLVNNRLAHGTTQNHQAGEEVSPDGLKFRERQLLAQQDGDNKAVFGFLETTNKFGLKVAKPGYDVLTTGDANLVFNSEQNVFKIVDSGTAVVSYAANAGQAETAYVHNLGYVPAALVYTYDGAYQPTPLSVSSTAGLVISVYDWYGTTTTITFRVTRNNVAGSGYGSASLVTFKYFLLQETAT